MDSDSGSRFVWLLSDELNSVRPVAEEDVSAACEFALSQWHVLPAVGPRVLEWGKDFLQSSPYVQQINDLIVGIRVLAQIQLVLCRRFTNELDQRRIPYTLLKGIATRLCAYSSPDLRCSLDVDVGVTSEFLRRAEKVATDLGFVPASLVESGRHFRRVSSDERAAAEANHYELACLVRRQVVSGLSPQISDAIRRCICFLKPWHETPDGRLACYVTLDIHHGLCLDISVDKAVATAQRWRRNDYIASVPSFEWLVFHLIFKLYWEGVHNYRKGGYQYADLLRLIEHLSNKAALSLIDLLEKYRLEAAGYYVLRRLDTEFHFRLPPSLKEFIRVTSIAPSNEFPNEVNDLGDMWPKIWGYR